MSVVKKGHKPSFQKITTPLLNCYDFRGWKIWFSAKNGVNLKTKIMKSHY